MNDLLKLGYYSLYDDVVMSDMVNGLHYVAPF